MTRQLPFTDEMRDAILQGRKTATSRTHRYGHAGDTLDSPAGPIRLVEVRRATLAEVADSHHLEEGFATPEGFRTIWMRLHPRAGWQPEQLVWFHRFERVSEVTR